MSNNIPPEEERFAKNTVIMAQAVETSISKLYNAGYQVVNPIIIKMATGVVQSFDKEYLIQGFIENSHQKCWGEIKQRNETFFVANASDIFKYLPMDKVNLFKDLFTIKDSSGKSVISQDVKDEIWGLFDAMIKISIKYVHRKREPYSYIDNEYVINAYKLSFFDDIDLNHHANIWSVKLEFPARV